MHRPVQLRRHTLAAFLVFAAASMTTLSALASEATTKPVPRDSAGWKQRHSSFNEKAESETWKLVFIGDSITQGWENNGKEVWQKYYGDRQAGNLGISGDETQHVIWRLENGNLKGQSPEVAVVMIGTNNLGNAKHQPAEVIDGVKGVVETVLEKSPETQVLLLGVFPRGQSPDDPYRDQIKQVNNGLSKFADGEQVHYLDIGPTFLEPDGSISKEIMPDFLHLSSEGYARWADAIEPELSKLLGEQN